MCKTSLNTLNRKIMTWQRCTHWASHKSKRSLHFNNHIFLTVDGFGAMVEVQIQPFANPSHVTRTPILAAVFFHHPMVDLRVWEASWEKVSTEMVLTQPPSRPLEKFLQLKQLGKLQGSRCNRHPTERNCGMLSGTIVVRGNLSVYASQ